ncbi:MAG TPA: cupin domain-containing protein [Casimicrobiaceae bacterium]
MIRLKSLIFVMAMSGGLLASTVGAQMPAPPGTAGTGTVRAVLGSTPLASVADAPHYFKLVRVHLPATQAVTYNGPVGFVLVLEGALEVTSGADQRSLAKSDAVLVAKGKSTIFKSASGKPAEFLHFVLSTAGELNAPMESHPAVAKELYRTTSPIPGLKPGPYEFTLVRVTFPPRFPLNPPHHRSGAALYYIFSGTGMFTADGKTEPRPAGAAHYEPYDLVHQWANPGEEPLVIIQASINQEGVPAVIFEQPAGAASSK